MNFLHNITGQIGANTIAEMRLHGEIVSVPFRRVGQTFDDTKQQKFYIKNSHAWAKRRIYDIQPLHPSIQPSGPNQYANVPEEVFKRLRFVASSKDRCWLDNVPFPLMAANTPTAEKQTLALGMGDIDLTQSHIVYEASDGYSVNTDNPLPADSLGDDILFYVRWFTPNVYELLTKRFTLYRENVAMLLNEGIKYTKIQIDIRDRDGSVATNYQIKRHALFENNRILSITAVNPVFVPCTTKRIVPHEIWKRMFLKLSADSEEYLGYIPFTMLAATSLDANHTSLSLVGAAINWQDCEILYRPEHNFNTPAYDGYPTQVELTVAYIEPRYYAKLLGNMIALDRKRPANYPPSPAEHINQY